MADLGGMGVRWPLGNVGFTSGGQNPLGNVPGMLMGLGLRQEQQQKQEADARAKAAQHKATLEQAAAFGAWDRGMKMIENPHFPSASKVELYNSLMRPAAESVGFSLPEVPAGTTWDANFTKYAKGFTAIMSQNISAEEKRRLAQPLWDEMVADPNTAPMIKMQQDQIAAERQQRVSLTANLAYRVLSGQASEEEATQFAAERAIANAPGQADELPEIAMARQERALILAEGTKLALAQRDEEMKRRMDQGRPLGKDQRLIERDPVTGEAREVIKAAPEGPALSQPLKDLLSSDFGVDVRALDPTKPNDAAVIARARRQLDDDARTKAVKDAEALIPVKVKEKRALAGVKTAEDAAKGREVSETAISGMRNAFTAAAKNFVEVRDAYARVQASAKDPSAAGDLSLIFNYMKILDPGSVVREAEFATAASTGAYGERIQSMVNRAINGQRLSDNIRKDFVDRAERLFGAQLGSHAKLEDEYRRIAKERGIEPSNVVIDYVGDLRGRKGGAPVPATDYGQLSDDELLKRLRQGRGGPRG